MHKIAWPTQQKNVNAQVWRVLDLSGITKSVRESRNFVRAGFVYLNGNLMTSFRLTVPLGSRFNLEVRFPNGRTKGGDIMLVAADRLTARAPRLSAPGTNNFINDPSKTNYRG